jgi:hypothetical protein
MRIALETLLVGFRGSPAYGYEALLAEVQDYLEER